MRFSLDQVAIMGDIECMFYQVNVLNDDCDCLRFIWWPGEKLDAAPVTYRMNVHLFGATSSPSCANFALLQCVEDNREYFDPVTCKAVENNLYVDDFFVVSSHSVRSYFDGPTCHVHVQPWRFPSY